MATRSQQLRVIISGDASHLKRTFAQAEMAGNKFEKGMGASMSRVGNAMRRLSIGAFAGAGFGISALVKAGVDYEKQMARVHAVTDATGEQFKSLGDLAKQLGKDTKFSAGQAAEAMYELGSAGFRAQDMAKVLPGTLSLAAASSIELADAAEISSNALRGFGLASDQSARVADVLAQAVASSSVEMKDLQYTLKYIGPVAKLTGQSFEDMIAAVELMGNAGIKGEQAGTSLRGALVRLTKPTKMVDAAFEAIGLRAQDLQGPKGLKPLPEIIRILAQHTDKLSKAQRNQALAQIFGTEALSGMSVLVDKGADALTRLADKNRNADGAAKRMANTMNRTVAGAFENLTGSIETAGITVFEKFQEPMRKGLLATAGLINDFPSMIKQRFDAANLLPAPRGKANIIATMLGTAIADVPWGEIGRKIAEAMSAGIKLSGDFARAVTVGIGTALSHVDGRKLLGGLLRVVSEAINAMFSPSFWRENFANIFATVTIAIPIARMLHLPGAQALYDHLSKPVFRAIAALGKGLVARFNSVAVDGFVAFLGGLERLAPRTAQLLLGLVTGTGRWLSGLPGKFRLAGLRAVDAITKAISGGVAAVAGAVGRLAGQIVKALGGLAGNFFRGGWDVAKSILNGIVRGIGKGMGAVGGVIRKGLKALTFGAIGDGIGKTLIPSGGKGSAALKGARAAMGPYAAIGSRFGLSVSSGRRPGAITSSGNTSYHSSGEAIDEAGSPKQMLAFFKYMKARFGGQLAELIYTPGGTGIKNGQPHKYTGQVAKDHFDHVHVAMDSGKPGVGDGLGKGQIMNLWTRAGGSAGKANLAAAVAMAESGGETTASNRNKNGTIDRGLWQINSVHGGLSTFSPTGNAKAAVKISSGGRNWTPWVAYTTGAYRQYLGGATQGATSRSGLDARLKGNLDRLDTLRNRLSNVPRGKAHDRQRQSLQGQIRSLVSANRGIRGDIRDAPSSVDVREQQEKQGSRIVNRIATPFMRGKAGISALGRRIAAAETTISTKDTEYGQAERRFGLTEEDLGTAAGRAKRTSELRELAKLKQAQLGRQKAELRAVISAIRKYDALIKKLSAQLKGKNRARGATAARIRKRLRDYEDNRIELAAQARSLGSAIEDTKLDLGDLVKEAQDVAATPDTAVEAGPSVSERVADLTSLIDLREHAGLIDAATAAQQKAAVIQSVLGGSLGPLDERTTLQLMGDLRDIQAQGVQAVEDNTSAIRDLQKAIDEQTNFARSVVATENASLVKSLADIVSGQIAGFGVAGRALMPGASGLRARY